DGTRAANVGHLTPQYPVTLGDRTALLDDLTGGGFTVLTDGAAPLNALDFAERDFLIGIGAAIVPLYADGASVGGYLDVPGGYLTHLREHGHVAAIVRPDFYLFGTATDGAGLKELVGQLRDQLQRPAATDRVPVPEPLTAVADQ
ncbi:bifunctional 3-(3-hydroxy-phenyl)propionate/3-hydroxycinnamic acid hydroxylase, partial [Streptomyces cinereospinus]